MRTYAKVWGSRSWGGNCNGWKKPISSQSVITSLCKPCLFLRVHFILHLLWQQSCLKFSSVVLLVWVCCARSLVLSGVEQKNSFAPLQKRYLGRRQQVRRNQNVKLHPFKIVKYPQKVWFVSKYFRLADTIHLCLAALTNYCLQTGNTDALRAIPAVQSVLSKHQHDRKHSSVENVHWQTSSAFNCSLFNWYYS